MNSDSAPATSAAAVEQAIGHQRAGRVIPAEQLYRRALAEQPDHPEAHHNLGIILLQSGRTASALEHFESALRHDAERDLYWLSYARALLIAGHALEASAVLSEGVRMVGLGGPAVDMLVEQVRAASPPSPSSPPPLGGSTEAMDEESAMTLGRSLLEAGRFAEAAALFRGALQRDPVHPDVLLLELGNALTELGSLPEAAEAFRSAIAINPALAEAHHHLGSLLSEDGRVAEGFAHLMRHAELVHGREGAPRPPSPEPQHKLKHDREQAEYLAARGVAVAGGAGFFHLGDGRRVDGFAVNSANATPELVATWRTASPQMIVIDNFLTSEALARLREFCADSTIWRRIYDAGYIGATPADGFASPLLAQIAEEIADLYGDIIGDHVYQYLGAFKYDSELSTGTNTHADFSAINVNFYIAPDEANLDPESGGMVIWDVEARTEAELRRYNSDEAALRAHLKRAGAKAVRVPHRSNRAVIFKSALFHRTDECRFRNGYLNKRINVSLLFGKWGESLAPN